MNLKITTLLIFFIILFISGCTSRNIDERCSQKIIGEGVCNNTFSGYEFEPTLSECFRRITTGCTAIIPFNSSENCLSTCKHN